SCDCNSLTECGASISVNWSFDKPTTPITA
ncbi:hypothetical protein CP082626L3_0944B, partial [Chlamydia psittaci 08-2626_L3]